LRCRRLDLETDRPEITDEQSSSTGTESRIPGATKWPNVLTEAVCHDGGMGSAPQTGPLLRVSVADDPDALQSLFEWLLLEDELRGHLRLEPSGSGTGGEMGGLLDVLTIAMGSGGVGAVLARSLSTWLTHRRADVKVTFRGPDGRSFEVDTRLDRDDHLPTLMREIRQLTESPEQQE
jgi:hypothetical protein